MWPVLLLQAIFGVVDTTQPFSPVPTPVTATDPCPARPRAGTWVAMSATDAPASIHNESWIDSAARWDGARLVVAARRDGVWHGSLFDPCANAWAALPATQTLPRGDDWRADGRDRPFVAASDPRFSSDDLFDHVSVWSAARKAMIEVTAPSGLAPRALYAMAVADTRALVWGGLSAPKPEAHALDDGAVLDLRTRKWRAMSRARAPSPRWLPTAVAWTGTRLVVWGGLVPDATLPAHNRLLGDGASYDPAADHWTPMSTADAPSARTGATVAWTGRQLVVVGGAGAIGDPAQLPDGGIYDPTSDRWTKVGAPPEGIVLPRANIGPLTRILVAADGRVLFLPERLTAIAVLDPDSARWSTIAVGALARRSAYRAFLVGDRLIIWGGMEVIAEHRCPPPRPHMPLCDPVSETAPRNDGAMLVLPPR